MVQAKSFSKLPTFYSFLSLYHSFLFHSTLQDPARFNTFIWVAPSCLYPKLFHAAIKPRNPCLTFTWTENDILSFLWKNPLMLSHFIYAHLSWCTSLGAISLISFQTHFVLVLAFVTHSCSHSCLLHPLFPVCFRADFKRAVLSVHDEVKSLSLLSGSPPTWGRDLPHTIAE